MPARSQGKLHMQRRVAELVEDYTWFEAFSEEGRSLHASVAYAG